MSYTELKIAEKNGSVRAYKRYANAWGGFSYIWDSIWSKYLSQTENDSWLFSEKNQIRLLNSVFDESIPGWIRLIHASTSYGAIVEYNKLLIISEYYKRFIETFPPNNRVCHLSSWSEDCIKIYNEKNSENCVGICFLCGSVNEDLWEDYNLSKGDKHWFVFKRYSDIIGV